MKSKKIGDNWICCVNYKGKHIEYTASSYLEAVQGVIRQLGEEKLY